MAQTAVRETSRWKRLVVGLAITVVATGLYAFPAVRNFLEPRFQDGLLWKLHPAADVSGDITIIEIDDSALERIAKWPWSWDTIGNIVDSLSALGARTVALDIIFPERPPPELRPGTLAEFPTGLSVPTSVLGKPAILVNPLPPFADALRRSDRTVIAFTLGSGELVRDPLFEPLVKELVARPTATPAELAQRLAVTEADVARLYLTARQRAVAIIVGREAVVPADSPAAAQLFTKAFPKLNYAPTDVESTVESNVESDVFHAALALRNMTAPVVARTAAEVTFGPEKFPVREASRMTPPLVEITQAARALGYANVYPDDSDGVVRRVPLLMSFEGRLLPQLGLQAALVASGAKNCTMRWTDRNTLNIALGDGRTVDVPVGADCTMVVNWSVSKDAERRDNFRHLPIGKIHEHFGLLLNVRVYEQAMAFAAARFPQIGSPRAALAARLEAARQSAVPAAEVAGPRDELLKIDERLIMEFLKLAASPRPADMTERDFELAKAYAEFIQAYMDKQESIEARLRQVEAELHDYIHDRVCFVGMTATAAAAMDLKPTPIHNVYAGVFVQATVAENILHHSFVREADLWMRLGIMLLVGLTVTFCAARLPAFPSATLACLALAAYWGLCLLLHARSGLLLPLAGPWLLSGAMSLLGVMVYRELTEGRNRRWITSVFKQYTSDGMVNELVANPHFLVLGGERRDMMTVYFSDIAGFTNLSERLDAPTLNAFLQAYLGEMTDCLLEQGATLDKYVGDAIVAFYGAPVAVPDHAARCLRAAVAQLRLLPDLDQRLHRDGLLPEDITLRIRIGIASGSMAVGNFGSTRRFDYTVIGDTVNVGARLEGASRFFGTTVLMLGATRDQALAAKAVPANGAEPGEFLLRRIGPVRFVGKDQAVEVYELLDDAAPNARAGLQEYDAAVKEFEGGWYNEARQRFEQVLAIRPNDGPTQAYLRRIDTLLRDGVAGPPGPWDMESK